MLRILHVIQGCGGGVASLIGNLVRSADKTEAVQDVLSFSYDNGAAFQAELERLGSRTFLLPRPRKEGMRAFRDGMRRVLDEGHYDVVHCHTDGWRSCLYRRIAKEAGVPVFCVHAHRAANDPGWLGNSKPFLEMERYFSRRNGDIKFACGRDAARFIYGDVEDYVTVPNGIDLARCHKAKGTGLRSGIREGQTVILQVGRLVTQKNHGFTVELARELRDRGEDFRIVIAGTGPLEDAIRKRLEAEALTDWVELLGRRDDIYAWMDAADVMILPSLYEGLPTVAIEAQAMGLHSIVADTVTAECDLGLGLIHRLPIREGPGCWAEAVTACRTLPVPHQEQIDRALTDNAYTAQTSVRRYLQALEARCTPSPCLGG